MEWEDIDEYHKRAKVVGGWLVKTYQDVFIAAHGAVHGVETKVEAGYSWQVSMCFIPDPDGLWVIK